jgi:hypothetical protein
MLAICLILAPSTPEVNATEETSVLTGMAVILFLSSSLSSFFAFHHIFDFYFSLFLAFSLLSDT